MPIYSSDSDDQHVAQVKLFHRERPLHAILGGGKVADVLLWKNNQLSAAILAGFTIIWFLFEVVEYNFVSLVCHISILTMLIVFVWSHGAGLINRNPPDIHHIRVPESTFRWLFAKINGLLLKFFDISRGKDLTHFFVTIAFLWILSVIGNYFSSLNLLYIGFLCLETLPVLFERYEKEVEILARKGNRDMKKLYKRLDSRILNKIPRGPVKEKKFKREK
ncbi:reticulon-like protein B9 [Cornus florida]|uniref:reticulon-like protein B9 n=1 Tax=Cornus florida TaxID=4283 RepID=UPI00289D9A26|nr:reticulon-like protein B9 [Cornus florida]